MKTGFLQGRTRFYFQQPRCQIPAIAMAYGLCRGFRGFVLYLKKILINDNINITDISVTNTIFHRGEKTPKTP